VKDIDHGTYNGAQQHRRRDEKPCESCQAAATQYQREYRGRTKDWRTQNQARNRAMWRLVTMHRDDYDRLYMRELMELDS
jgi:hypothetical protein